MKPLLVGDPSRFALESLITRAFPGLGQMALGFFVIHVQGVCYGVREPDATCLACSFGGVRERISRRGKYDAPFSLQGSAAATADAVRLALYSSDHDHATFFGFSRHVFSVLLCGLLMAPDGDAAFDDSSFIIHFDTGELVRLIAFKSPGSYRHTPSTLRELHLDADEFYGVLQSWADAFEAEWMNSPKEPAV